MKSYSLILIAISLVLMGCERVHEPSPPATSASIPITVVSPITKDLTVYSESIGTLHPSVLTEIHSQISGRLSEVLISEGDEVEAGTPLFKIESKPSEIKVHEAEAQYKIDQANLNQLSKKIERYRPLLTKDLVSQTEWDDLEAQLERAKGALSLAQARLDLAKLELERCTLYSPIKGRVGKLEAYPGLLVSIGSPSPLVTISKMDPLIVEWSVTEQEFSKLPKEMQTVELSSLCSSDCKTEGVATFIDNHFNPKTGLLAMRAKVQNPNYRFRPGQSVHVRVPVATLSQSMLIPQKTVRYSPQGPYVYVVQPDQTVALKQINLGIQDGLNQVVTEGIASTDLLVLEGHFRLSNGSKVDVQP